MVWVGKNGDGELDTIISLDRNSDALIVAVTGGGGGVGKTSFIAHAASALAQSGQRVLVVDQNSGSSTAGRMLGTQGDGTTLRELLSKPKKQRENPGATGGGHVSFVHGGGNAAGRFGRQLKNGDLYARMRSLDYDTILVDLGLITDRLKEDSFVHADHRVIVVAPGEQYLENPRSLVPMAVIRCFENSAKLIKGSRKTANSLRELFAGSRTVDPSEINAWFKSNCPELLDKWTYVVKQFGVSVVANRLKPGKLFETVKKEVAGLLDSMPHCVSRSYFLPQYGVNGGNLMPSGTAAGFVDAVGAIILDILGMKPLDTGKEDEVFVDTYYGSGDGKSDEKEKQAGSKSGHGGLIRERNEKIAQLDKELEYIRSEKYAAMSRLLGKNIEERRNAAFARLEVQMGQAKSEMEEKLRRVKGEKMAGIMREGELRRSDLSSEAANDIHRKSQEMDGELARRREACLREIDEEMEGYYRSEKLTFDREMVQRRKRMESEIGEELLMKKKKDRTRMEHELAVEVDKVREMIWQQLEEKRVARLNQVDKSVVQYRQDRKKEVERECRQKHEFLEKRMQNELELKQENLVMEVFRDVMEISAMYDVEEHNRKSGIVKKLSRELEGEKETGKRRLNIEMARIREEKEKELFEQLKKQRDGRMAAFETDIILLRDEMKEQVSAEAQKARRELMDEVAGEVNRRRTELLVVLDKEKQQRYFELKREMVEVTAKKKSAVRQKVEELENSLQGEMRIRVLNEEKRISNTLDESFGAKKRDKEKILAALVKEERSNRIKELNEELIHRRRMMVESLASEMRLVKEQYQEKQRVELAALRRQKLTQLDKDVQDEIRRRTETASYSVRDVEVSLRAEMQERLSQEEVRVRRVMDANLELEINELRRKIKSQLQDEEARLRTGMKTYLDKEKKKQLEHYEGDMRFRKGKHEESLNEWKEKQKVHLMRDIMARLDEEEQVHRDLMASRLDYERRRMQENLSIIRKKAERTEERKLHSRIARKKEEAISKVRSVIRDEYQKRLAAIKDNMADEKTRMQIELSHELSMEKTRRLTELNSDMQKTKMSLSDSLDSELREVRRRKEVEAEHRLKEEEKQLEERLNRRYKDLVKRKEEWLEFETRRKRLEFNEAVEKEIAVEKDKQLGKQLIELELEMAGRRKKNSAAAEEEKARLLVSLRDEMDVRRRKMLRKMSVKINEKLVHRRDEIEREIERYRKSRERIIEKEQQKARAGLLAKMEAELKIERERRYDLMDAKMKAEEYEKRQKIIDEIMKKKDELDRLFELERRKYFERLQNEMLSHRQISPQYVQQEMSRLQKTWRLN